MRDNQFVIKDSAVAEMRFNNLLREYYFLAKWIERSGIAAGWAVNGVPNNYAKYFLYLQAFYQR